MSDEEFDKANRINKRLRIAASRLARVTVQRGLDPGVVMGMLIRALEYRNTVWPTLTDDQKREVLAALRAARQHGTKGRRTDRKG